MTASAVKDGFGLPSLFAVLLTAGLFGCETGCRSVDDERRKRPGR